MSTYKLTIRPSGEILEIKEGENILDVLRRKDIHINASCDGHATCADCIVKIVSGEDNLAPPSFAELKLLGNVFHLTKERLACQLSVTGDTTIDISAHAIRKEIKKTVKKKPAPVKVRKEKEVQDIQTDRLAFREQKHKNQEEWQKHWEKGSSETNKKSSVKKLGGNKRPRFFDTDKIDYDKKDFSRPLPEHKKKEKDSPKEEVQSDKDFRTFRDKK